MKSYIKFCPVCGKEFRTHKPNKTYCNSLECNSRKKNKKRQEKNNIQPRKVICSICHKEFETTQKNQILCGSEHCKNKRHEQLKEKYTSIDYMTKNGNRGFYAIRFFILRRDGFRCQYCGRTPRDKIKLEVDHIVPRSKEGKNDYNNLITSCEICNAGKGDLLLSLHEKTKIDKLINERNGIDEVFK